jgi:hypothetical protein
VGSSRTPGPTTTTGRWFLSVRYPYPENRCLPPWPSTRRVSVTAIENHSTSAGQPPRPTPGDHLLHARRKDTKLDTEPDSSGRARSPCWLRCRAGYQTHQDPIVARSNPVLGESRGYSLVITSLLYEHVPRTSIGSVRRTVPSEPSISTTERPPKGVILHSPLVYFRTVHAVSPLDR